MCAGVGRGHPRRPGSALRAAFDSDVLIYAVIPGHPLGRRVAALFSAGDVGETAAPAGVGSVLLLPEVLAKPRRDGRLAELASLAALLSRLDLRPVDEATAEVAVALAAVHRLRAADAVHLATALCAGADRFITNDRRDFLSTIPEIDVVYPDGLPEPTPGGCVDIDGTKAVTTRSAPGGAGTRSRTSGVYYPPSG